jgi:hypothetical protein
MMMVMQQDANEHLQKLLVAWDGTRSFAEMFERLMITTTDSGGQVLLVRMLSEADQMIAEMDESIDREQHGK